MTWKTPLPRRSSVFRLDHARKLIREGKTPTEAAQVMQIGRTTLYRALQSEAA